MRGPKSFTAEDTVEIDCHGGVLITKKILETVLKYGARPAEPGEFTKRAFLNGRMDLAQAEAVIDVINSKNDYALKASVSQLDGAVSKAVKALREQIIYQIAFIESALDDPCLLYTSIPRSGWKYGGHPEKRPLTGFPIPGIIHRSSSYCCRWEQWRKWSDG